MGTQIGQYAAATVVYQHHQKMAVQSGFMTSGINPPAPPSIILGKMAIHLGNWSQNLHNAIDLLIGRHSTLSCVFFQQVYNFIGFSFN